MSKRRPTPKRPSASKRSSASKRAPASEQSAAPEQSPAPERGEGGARTPDTPMDDSPLDDSNPRKGHFTPETLDGTVIAIPLLRTLKEEEEGKRPAELHAVIIDLNLLFPGGRNLARDYVTQKLKAIFAGMDVKHGDEDIRHKIGIVQKGSPSADGFIKPGGPEQYVFAKLSGKTIRKLVSEDNDKGDSLKKEVLQGAKFARAVYHVWPDFPVHRLTTKSYSTVKADAAHASFAAFGEGIVWAVLDSGIDAKHPHFQMHKNLELDPPLVPMDFTGQSNTEGDPFGHGTHVAGIIAGEAIAGQGAVAGKRGRRGKSAGNGNLRAAVRRRDENGDTIFGEVDFASISGMAPKCKLVNMRVLDQVGRGEVSSIIAALSTIQEINGHGRRLLIHGVNLSIGNDFEPEWFACGQSPLCVEVNRLVQSGVVVVVAAGNSGYGTLRGAVRNTTINTGLALTINDPGNAALAITVGSTHREMPHMYGVSYFSSKGPTGDGRLKPDLVAPGEKIISCAAGVTRAKAEQEGSKEFYYAEDSGTSMAAPHVSGVIAAFLSVRREFIGHPEKVKEIFLSTATDLQRERYFQGNGLVDLMRAIQSV